MNERRRLLCNLYVCVYAHRYVVSCLLFVFSSFEFTRLFRIASRHAALFPLWLTLARLHAQWSGWLAGWLAYLFLTGRGSLGLFRIGYESEDVMLVAIQFKYNNIYRRGT